MTRDWEKDLDRELKALSNVRAPRTLLPRVLAVAEARAKQPAWLRRWYASPLWARVLVLAAAAAAGALLARSLGGLWLASAGPWLTVARAVGAAAAYSLNAAASLWWTWRVPLVLAGAASATACAAGAVLLAVISRASRPAAGRGLA